MVNILVNSKVGMKKIGFTLAEVLITLGIIGVIAALTIPNLMGHYRKVVAENKLKSTYAILSTALEQVNAENGLAFIPDEIMSKYDQADVNGYSWELSRDVFEHYFAPHFHIIKRYDNKNLKPICNQKKEGCASMTRLAYHVRLKNGVRIGFMQQNQGSKGGVDNAVFMNWMVILSPDKNFYIAGKDFFTFQVARTLRNHDYNMNLKALNPTVSRSKIIENCLAPTYYPQGSYYGREAWCTALIFQNGMNIPDDYPVKF